MEKNKFFDIKPLKDWSILWFPISMSNISTKQSVKKCMDYLNYFGDKKAGEPKIGLEMNYTEFLYMNSKEKSSKIKEKFMFQIVQHKKGMEKSIHKNRMKMQIQHAFHFGSWSNLYFQVEGDFNVYFKKLKNFYQKDKLFRKYLKEDCKFNKRKLTNDQVNFFLEEHLMVYLGLFKKIRFTNEYVQGREKNILLIYPGIPPKAQVYLLQKNPFNFKTNNKFIGQYNLENKKFYDYNNIEIEKWDHK